MWLVLGALGGAHACGNELEEARERLAAARAADIEHRQLVAIAQVRARLERDVWLVQRELSRRARAEREAELRAAAEAERERRAWWGTLGAAVGLLGAIASAGVTTWLAVRVERAGGPREVRYA